MKTKNNKRNKRGRRLNYGQPRQTQFALPARFPRAGSDVTTIRCKGLTSIESSTSAFSKEAIWLVPFSSAFVKTLASIVPNLDAFSQLYSRYIVSNMTVRVIPTISVLQGATFAASYEPALNESPSGGGNPTGINDVVISVHHCITTQTTAKSFSCRPIDYYGDWRACTKEGAQETQNNQGLIQVYSSYTTETADQVIGQVEVDFTISFCGLRQFTPSA